MTVKRDAVGMVVITGGTNLYDKEKNSHANTPNKKVILSSTVVLTTASVV
jgi:hypothetical protein